MTYEWDLPDDLAAARIAREHVGTVLAQRDIDDLVVDDCVLVASELAANAIRHGAPPVTLRLDVRDASILIEVHDRGTTTEPSVNPPSATAGSGRGLALVRDIALDHGWMRGAGGVTVWAEISRRAHPSP